MFLLREFESRGGLQRRHVVASDLPFGSFVGVFLFAQVNFHLAHVDVLVFFVFVVEDPAVEPQRSTIEVKMEELRGVDGIQRVDVSVVVLLVFGPGSLVAGVLRCVNLSVFMITVIYRDDTAVVKGVLRLLGDNSHGAGITLVEPVIGISSKFPTKPEGFLVTYGISVREQQTETQNRRTVEETVNSFVASLGIVISVWTIHTSNSQHGDKMFPLVHN